MTIRHNCETHGCYVKVQTPDWGFLDNSFSGKIRVGDIDGVVEANGCLLILEWKGEYVPIPTGQKIMFEKITNINNIVVFVISGDPEKTQSSNLKIFSGGAEVYDEAATNNDICRFCEEWEVKARNGDFFKE